MAGDFNRDGNLDLAVLMEDTGQVWIYTGNGNGTFQHTFSIPVGEEATGLSVVPGNGPGLFESAGGQRLRRRPDPRGQGRRHLPDPGESRFAVRRAQFAGPRSGRRAGRRPAEQPRHGPGAVGKRQPVHARGRRWAARPPRPSSWRRAMSSGRSSTEGRPFPTPIVVGTGSNTVEVYRTTSINDGVPTFAPSPETYFVGTAPASVTVADINGDGIPDMLVANQGSNDVSVIFGSYNANGDWVGIPGPRLKSGGDGPIAVIVRDLTGNLVPDLAVVNGGSGTVTLLPGVGGGFFDDQQPEGAVQPGQCRGPATHLHGQQRCRLRRDGRREPGAVRPRQSRRRRQRGVLRPAGAWPRRPCRAGKSWWPSPTASSISWPRKATA